MRIHPHQRWKESPNEKIYFMNPIHDKPGNEMSSATPSAKPVNFFCPAPGAKQVCLVGDFNNWKPMLMERRNDGWWFLQVWVPHGQHQYHFLVDGEPMLDLHATGMAHNDRNEPMSLIAVS